MSGATGPVTIIVCGGRDFARRGAVYATLDRLARMRGVAMVIEGGCPTGADAFAREWAMNTPDVHSATVYAEWGVHGPAAGPIRNQAMLDEYRAVLSGVVAFPGGKGTADMVRRARAAGVPVWEPLRPRSLAPEPV